MEAAAEAGGLARELHERGEKLQEFAEGLDSLIEGYAELRGRLMDARRRSGDPIEGRGARTRPILESWFRSVFGGHGSIVGVPSEQQGQVGVPNRSRRALTERDPLASPRTK